MIIYPQAMEINSNDDELTILSKKYYASLFKIYKKWENDEETERLRNFDKKYDEIKRIKNNMRTSIQQLQLMTALDEILNE